jgi:hypothetical protein
MPDTGLPFELPYPAASDLVRDAPGAFQDLAEQVEEYLLVKETAAKTASYTLALGDTSRVVVMNVSGASTLTVPANSSVAFPVGAVVAVYNVSTSAVTVQGAGGVTVRNAPVMGQFREISLRKRDTNEWVAVG